MSRKSYGRQYTNHFCFVYIPGSVHGAPTGNAAPFEGLGLGIVGKKLEEYAYLCPGLFPWVNPGPATHESGKKANGPTHTSQDRLTSLFFFTSAGMHVTKLVGLLFVLIFCIDLLAAVSFSGSFAILIYLGLMSAIIGVLLIISRQPQNR